MSKTMPIAPTAPMVDDYHLDHNNPPPTYEQAMGHHPIDFVPPPGLSSGVPNPQQQNYIPPAMTLPQVQCHVSTQPAPVVPQATTTVILAGAVPVGPRPTVVYCPVCHMNIRTRTIYETQAGAHLACIVLYLLGCCLCSCIPYFMDSCKNVRHSCPNCKAYLGTYRP